jgi:hypothetical protein
LIIAGYGFWVGLEFLGFGIDSTKFAIELWGGNSNWIWKPFGIPIWYFSEPINFYFFRDFSHLGWSDIYFGFRLFLFIFLFIRLIKSLIGFWQGKLLKFEPNPEKIITADKQRPSHQKIYTSGFFVFSLVSFYFFNIYLLSFEAIVALLFYTSFLALQIVNILSYSPKLFTLYFTGKEDEKSDYRISAGLAIWAGSLDLVVLAIYSITSQIIISKLIFKLLITAKHSSLIQPEEPLNDYNQVAEMLTEESKFLKEVKNFTNKKILKYPHQNLQNRSQVYAIDGAWGSGKSTFIKLVASLVCKEKEFKNIKINTEKWIFKKKLKFFYSLIEETNFKYFNPLFWLQSIDLINRQGENNTVWIDFNPWNYLSGEKIVEDFFDTLDNRLDKIYGHGLGKKLSKYVNLLTSTVSPTFLGLADKFGGWEFGLNPLSSNSDLGSLKSDIENKLRSIKEKIVIVIDDIDRLPPEMVLIVLRLVGITANFPNIFFILAMDYDKVEKIVQKELGEQYQNYLQKIVNERVAVPKWEYEDLEKMFNHYTKNAVEEFGKLEGLEGFNSWQEFEGKIKNEKNLIFENYMIVSFFKYREKRVGFLVKNNFIKLKEFAVIEEFNVPSEERDIYENFISRYFNNKYLAEENDSPLLKGLFQDPDIENIDNIALKDNKAKYDFLSKINIHKGYIKKTGIKYFLIILDLQNDLEDELIINELKKCFSDSKITPRDIKQLANSYIYGVAEVYDELVKENLDRTGWVNPIDVDFQAGFKDRLNKKLPQIVQETVNKQFFGLG